MTVRDRRALWCGGIILLSAWLALVGVPRLIRGQRITSQRVDIERGLLLENRRSLESLPVMEDSARILTARVAALAPKILSGSETAVALSDLSGRLSTLISLCHGRMSRFEAAPDSLAAGELRQLKVEVDLESDFRGLGEILERLSRDPLVTVVERVQVTVPDPLAGPSVAEPLNIRLRLTAWYLARERNT